MTEYCTVMYSMNMQSFVILILTTVIQAERSSSARYNLGDYCGGLNTTRNNYIYGKPFQSIGLSFSIPENATTTCDVTIYPARDQKFRLYDTIPVQVCSFVTFYMLLIIESDGWERIDTTCPPADVMTYTDILRIRVVSSYHNLQGHVQKGELLIVPVYFMNSFCQNHDTCCYGPDGSHPTLNKWKVAMCDQSTCLNRNLLCDGINHCKNGGDEKWCQPVWVWVLVGVGGAVALGVVYLLLCRKRGETKEDAVVEYNHEGATDGAIDFI